MEKKSFKIESENKGKRLDVFLQENCVNSNENNLKNLADDGLSRSRIKSLIMDGNVLVNGKIPSKSGQLLKTGDAVELTIPSAEIPFAKPENIPLEIVYEDDDLAVINKPQGMVVHAGNGVHDKTLVNALLFHIKNLSGINGVLRPGIVHRLDKNTAGLMLVAKNDLAHRELAKQIENKTAKRQYLAILEGHLKENSGIIETNICRNPKNRKIMAVCGENQGKIAITEYKVLQVFNGYSLVQFNLKTGRTHQIRVHCKDFLHHPIANDVEYGGGAPKILYKKDEKSQGQYLFAQKIEFIHPRTSEKMAFEIDMPSWFKVLFDRLKEEN